MKKTLLTIATLATMSLAAHNHHHNAVYEACQERTNWAELTDDQKEIADYACMAEQQKCEDDTLDYCLDSTLNVDDELEFCGKLADLHCDMGVITTEQVTDAINNSTI